MTQKTLLVIAGPTAVGKTDVSIRLAEELGTEILSADSRQFFREMNVGTAKPTAEEMRGVPHHFINSHSITEEYNAGAFERDALKLLEHLFETHHTVILVGGSGLYVKTLCDGMDEMPEVNPEIRKKLNRQFTSEGMEPLQAQLHQLDPAYYEVVDRQNPVRLIRALEVCLSTGIPYSSFRLQTRADRPFRIIKLALDREREELYRRIDLRMDQMLANGLVEEATLLYPHRHHQALQTVGYSEVFGFLDGEYDEEEMVMLLKRNSRRYAKRQLTWFRKDPAFHWLPATDYQAIQNFVLDQLRVKQGSDR